MTATPTAATPTPEELAARVSRLRDSLADPECFDWTCPQCGHTNLKGCETRPAGEWVAFRRECDECGFDASDYDLSTEARAIIEAQRAEIERLNEQNADLEKAALTAYENGVEHAFEAAKEAADTALSASLEGERAMREALEAAMRLVEEYGCRTGVAHIADDCDTAVAMCRAALAAKETTDAE